jgi:hypothetical protein
MTETTRNEPNHEKEERIKKLLQENSARFDQWLHTPEAKQTPLSMPEDVLKIFIPEALYRQSINPEQVTIHRFGEKERWGSELTFIIYEPTSQTRTDPKIWSNHQERLAVLKARAKETGDYYALKSLKLPDGIDPMHFDLTQRVPDIESRFRDLIYIYYTAGLRHKPIKDNFYGQQYLDNPQMRGHGISKAMDLNKDVIAAKLGFRFTSGLNDPNNVSFFVDKLGHTPLNEVKPEKRTEIMGEYEKNLTHFYTISFLREGDKENYLKSHNNPS